MANMSYCRFENTLHDLADCVNALDGVVYDGESISESEWKHAKRMKEWCERFIETFDDIEEEDINIIGYTMTPKHGNDICLLQSKAKSMTFKDFFAWVKKNSSGITLMGDFADFDYGSITATIDAKNDCLCGRFDCRDENGNWEGTINCGSVSFKK